MIGQSAEDWNDDFIMKVFHDSVRKHKTKHEKYVKDAAAAPVASMKRKQQVAFVDPQPTHQVSQDSVSPPKSDQEEESRKDYKQYQTGYFGETVHSSSLPMINMAPITKELLDEAQHSMLMAWYQSGYATGRYHALCELAEGQWHGSYYGSQQQQQYQHDQSTEPPLNCRPHGKENGA